MNVGTTYTTIRTSRKKKKKTNEAKIHAKKKKKRKPHSRINSPLRISHTHRPQRKLGSGMEAVRPAQLVVPVAKEYRSRV